MKQYSFLQSKTGKMLLLAYLCAALFLGRESMYTLYMIGFYPAQFAFLGLTAVLGAAFAWQNRQSIPELLGDRRIKLLLCCAAMVLLPPIIKRDWQLMYANVFICILIAVFLSFFADTKELAGMYVLVMTVLGSYSVLATYVLRIPADRGMLAPATFLNAFDAEFYNFYLANVSIDFAKNRNFGIFREPGVYQFFLMLGLYLNNYEVDWEDNRLYWCVNIILSVTMLTTFATGGVLTLGLFVVVVYFEKKWYRTRQGRILAAAALGIVLVAVGIIIVSNGELYFELYLMLIKFGNGSDSITDRVGSPIANMGLLLSSPIWGRGLNETLNAVANNTSSSTILYAILGIVGGSLNVAGWFALVWKRERNVIWNLLLLAILAVAFNTQNLITNLYFWLFPMMAMVERWLPQMGKERH